jgi:predicted Zn-dependent protease
METSAVADAPNTTDFETPSGGKAPALFIVVGLLLLVGGAVAYVLTSTAPVKEDARVTARDRRGQVKPLSTEAFDQVLNTAQKLIDQGENAKAETLFKQVLASHAEAQEVHIQYARFLAGQRRAAESYKEYQAAMACGSVEPEVLLEAGTTANMSGQPNLAVEHYAAAQAAAPTDYRPPMYLAQVQLKLKQTDEAKKNLVLAARLNPTAAAPAWATLAQIYLDEGNPGLAITTIDNARKLDPKSTLYRLINARALKRQNDPKAALELLVGLSDAQKHEPGVMQVMSECYGMLQMPAEAAKMYTDASDAEPTNGEWAFQAAVWLERVGDKPRAADYAKRAATLNVEGAAALASRLSS